MDGMILICSDGSVFNIRFWLVLGLLLLGGDRSMVAERYGYSTIIEGKVQTRFH